MGLSRFGVAVFTLFISLSICYNSQARSVWDKEDKTRPPTLATADQIWCTAAHTVGNMRFAISNMGTFGGGSTNCFIGEELEYSEYPKGSMLQCLWGGALWVGAVIGTDTLVSTGTSGWISGSYEMHPDQAPFGDIIYRSIMDPDIPEYEGALSEQDYIVVYTDTFTNAFGIQPDYFRNRPHMPLYVEITQKSYSWSYGYADDFILFDLSIRNIGPYVLKDFYLGLYIDSDVGYMGAPRSMDDVCGFLSVAPSPFGCGYEDTVNIAWTADTDGDPLEGEFIDKPVWVWAPPGGYLTKSCRGVSGVRIIHSPDDRLSLSYNWWVSNMDPNYDFGPRHKENYRDFRTGGLGTPEGDVNKYHILSNGEFDYDQVYTASIRYNDPVWMLPDQEQAGDYADGFDTRYVLSYGPFQMEPGHMVPITFAYVGGETFHTDPHNIDNLPYTPDRYYDNVDFSELVKNSIWAEWVYDNPGVDTDGDDYYGEFRVCVYDSALVDGVWDPTAGVHQYFRGDGVPDWRAAGPPPPPVFWLEPVVNGIRVRFNGEYSETTKDIFSQIIDFEGYRVYFGRDSRIESYSLVASYDRDNYDKYVYNPNLLPVDGYEIQQIPFSLDELRCLYGGGDDPCTDSSFNPLAYTTNFPYILPGFSDSLFFFLKHDYNAGQLGITTPIRKIYPDEPMPDTHIPDSLAPERLTDDGYLKYYEYEFTIENLLPTVVYYVNVTAFDFGSPESDLEAMETSVTLGAKSTYPFGSEDQLAASDRKVFIYPNPYRIDESYRARGYEGRMQEDRCDDRVRAVHFENLPAKCWIKIYSLDGDLVRKILHDFDPSDPLHTHDEWGLISRNGQAVVSGLYYWVVESPDGSTQMGKLVIIM